VIGGPDWINSDRFDITAKLEQQESETDPNRVSTRDKRGRSAVRALLAERFQLRLRQESRELPVYSLIVEKGRSQTDAQRDGRGTSVHVQQQRHKDDEQRRVFLERNRREF
jgi:uncharacterized protein (TIGR03435 family)